ATELAPGEANHRWPQILHGSKSVMYTAISGTAGLAVGTIKIRSLIDGRTKTIQEGGTYGRIIQTHQGHTYLTYLYRNTLFAAPFDLDRLEMAGSPVPVLEGVGSLRSGMADMDISPEGTLVYRGLTGAGLLTLQWMDATGNLQPLLSKPDLYSRPSLSPLGDRVAVEIA